jgi:hypothetical protein
MTERAEPVGSRPLGAAVTVPFPVTVVSASEPQAGLLIALPFVEAALKSTVPKSF